jgi:hypothetical protein
MTRAARKKRVWREEKRFMDMDAPLGWFLYGAVLAIFFPLGV